MIVDIPTEVGPKFRFRVGDNKKVWKLPSLNDLPIKPELRCAHWNQTETGRSGSARGAAGGWQH